MNAGTLRHGLRDVLLRPAAQISRRRSGSGGDTVLILQPDHLGDILLSQPAVNRIRALHPNHRLIAVVGPWSEAITRLVWPVDDVMTVDFPGFNRDALSGNPAAPYLELRQIAARLRHLNPSAAYVLRPDAWWAAWLAALVTGGQVMASDDPRVAPFRTHEASISPDDHAVARAIAIALGDRVHEEHPNPNTDPLVIPAQPDAQYAARRILQDLGIDSEYIVIHPGAGAEVKQWPADRWRLVAAELSSVPLPVLITGTQAESDLAGSIARAGARVISVAGQTPLPVLIEILRAARLVLGPDSGPLHLAVACQTPTVHLFGPSSPQRYGPWGPPERHRVVHAGWSCSRCGDLSPGRPAGCGCMNAIQPRAVICAAHEMLNTYAHQ